MKRCGVEQQPQALQLELCVCAYGFEGRCWKEREKSHMQTLMMLSGGTAPFQIEAGRGNRVIWEERKVAAEE